MMQNYKITEIDDTKTDESGILFMAEDLSICSGVNGKRLQAKTLQ